MSQLALMLIGIIAVLALVLGAWVSARRTAKLARSRPRLTVTPGQVIGWRRARRHETPGRLYPILAIAGGSAPVIPDLAASTINRKWVLEVNTGSSGSPVWAPMGGLKNFAPVTDEANIEDDGRYSDGGFSRGNKTGTGWNATATVSRAPKSNDLTSYDDVQEFLRNVAEGNLGTAAQAQIRWYEFDTSSSPRVQAYMGTAIVAFNEPGGPRTGLSEATFTFTGQGKLNKISHPYPNSAAVPSIYSVTPSTGTTFGTGGGTGFRIVGAHFTGTTAVTFGGTNATSFVAWGDSEITGVAPAKTAGAQNVVVTNGAGASSATAVTYA